MSLDDLDNVWVSELIFAVDAETMRIIDITGDIEASLGVQPEILVGSPLYFAIHRDDLDEANAAFVRTIEEGRATWEGRVQCADGTFVHYGWEGRLGLDGSTVYARSRDVERTRKVIADIRVYERLADLAADVMLVVDNNGRVVQANQAALDIFEDPDRAFIGAPLTAFVADESLLQQFVERLKGGESVIDFRVPSMTNDGRELMMEGIATFDSVTQRWYVVERDVTERVAREHELEITQRFFDLSSSPLMLLDSEDRVVRANPSFLDVADLTLEEVEGSDIVDALGIVVGADLRSRLATARTGGVVDPVEVQVKVGGAKRMFEVHLSVASDGGAVYLSCRDVTEERSLQAEMVHRANHDPLTGLANRAALREAMEGDLSDGAFVAIVTLDLDGFKKINDSFGHSVGDALLVAISDRLSQRTRGVDVVARMGGDEFVILLRGVPDLPTVELVGEKIRRAFLEPFDVGGRLVDIIASVGGTAGHRSTHSSEELLIEADLAAYSAKKAADGRCRVFGQELRSQADFSSAVEEHLHRVLSAEHFDLDIVEYRGRDETTLGLGVIAPAVASSGERRWNQESMRIAKGLGLLGPISKRLTAEAMRQLGPWLNEHPDCYLEIVYNLSEVSMKGFHSTLLEALARNGLDPRQFVVSLADQGEIDARLIDPEAIDALRDAGVRVALCDSFADAQTLSVLTAIGIDRIDVDAASVAATAADSMERMIANTVMEIADQQGIVVMVDADFNPDVVDVGLVYGDCEPLGVTIETPVPIEEFVGTARVDERSDDSTSEQQPTV